jgi:hypothetical protein
VPPGTFPRSPEWMVMCPDGFILINGRAQSYGAVEREQGETSVVVRFGGAEATDALARADARHTPGPPQGNRSKRFAIEWQEDAQERAFV